MSGISVVFLSACAGPISQIQVLRPEKSLVARTAYELGLANPQTKDQANEEGKNILVTLRDTMMIYMVMWELDDIFWLHMYFYNSATKSRYLDPNDFILMDNSRTMFTRLEPDVAANIYASQVDGIPEYQPKYNYEVKGGTVGYYDALGNYRTRSNYTVQQNENLGNALGYAIGAAITKSRNRDYTTLASNVYNMGMVFNQEVPSQVGVNTAIYWLKRKDYPRPLRLRSKSAGQEFEFTRARKNEPNPH